MRIAVNTRMLIHGKMEGIGNFTYETMKRLTTRYKEHEFIFLFDRPFDSAFLFSDNVIPVEVSPPARHPLLWYLWHEWSLPPVLKRYRPDVFIGTDGYLCLRSDIPSVAVIHDLNFEHYPGDLPFFNRLYYRHFFPRYAKKAKRIAAVSAFTAQDVADTYGIRRDKIDVVYNGVSGKFIPAGHEIINATRGKYAGGWPYFIFIGALHKRKNIARLLTAYDLFRGKTGSSVKLVLAGQKRWWTEDMEEAFQQMKHKEDVIFTGRVEEAELIRLTASALAMVYVSVFEGFGIPILEAMRCGVPVITSNVTSMPEVAGEAAMLCDPFSTESISDAMIELYTNEALRSTLAKMGFEREKLFTWDNTAQGIWNCVQKAISG